MKPGKKFESPVRTLEVESPNLSANSLKKYALSENSNNNNALCYNPIWLTIKESANLLDISERAVQKNCKNEKYITRLVKKRGGTAYEIRLDSLPVDAQIKYWQSQPAEILLSLDTSQVLPAVKAAIDKKIAESFQNEAKEQTSTINNIETLEDKEAIRRANAVSEALHVPANWKMKDWQKKTALKYETTYSTLRRWINKETEGGIDNLRHGNTRISRTVAWDKEAINFWKGLYLKKQHRKISKKGLYQFLKEEAKKQGWRVGSYESALQYLKDIPETFLAYRNGGLRGLDNQLPSIRRTYHDLRPFQIIVGDQHRYDRWVVDDETGEVFRPEGYVWQDLNTRNIYGFSVGKKYDSMMIGHSLYVGLKIFGKFECVYTDNGRPELSKYLLERKSSMRALNLEHKTTDDVFTDENNNTADPDVSGVLADLGADQRLAIVKNAKAKMIEGTFGYLEGIMTDICKLPGNVKQLGGLPEHNDIDEAEIKKLADQGKLPTFSEFAQALIKAFDYYNGQRPHRGLIEQYYKETGIRDNSLTPISYLNYCMKTKGWRPTYVEGRALDLIFLKRAMRTVQRGRIQFNYDFYESDRLLEIASGTKVEVRYDPLDLQKGLVVIHDGEYFCDATPIEYSSDEQEKEGKQGDAKAEKQEKKNQEARKKPLPDRPKFFLSDYARYKWCQDYLLLGGELSRTDAEFCREYEKTADPESLEIFEMKRKYRDA